MRDSPAFDEWQFFEAERLRQMLATALERLIMLQREAGDHDAAIDAARRRLAIDTLHEPAHQLLMQLYAQAGQRSAALRQYRACAQLLAQELGVQPSDETVRIYDTIRAAPSVQASAASTSVMHTPMPRTDTTLVGRDAERERLRARYVAAQTGAVAVIEGPPGIGKTRLADDLLAFAREQHAPVLVARCYDGEAGLAYAPVAALLHEATMLLERQGRLNDLPRDQIAEVARLVPVLARRFNLPEAAPVTGPDGRRRFFEAVTDLLLIVCRGAAPGVVLIDDVHWADGASLDLLAFLARRWRGHPGLLMLTWRSEDVLESHPLRVLSAEARRAGTSEQLTLSGLSVAAVAMLASEHRVPQSPDLIAQLHRESEGLPLLVCEYLDALSTGALATDTTPWPLPGGAQALMTARLHRLSESSAHALLAAAVIGRAFDFATLCAAADTTEEQTINQIEAFVARGLVVETDPAALRYDFSHGKLRDVVLARASPARQRLVHRRVADYLAGLPDTPGQPALAARIAHHYAAAGLAARAAVYHRRAGDAARALYAHSEALTHYAAAIAASHPEPALLHEAVGDLHALAGAYAAALHQYALARATGGASAVIERKLGEIAHRLGDWATAEAHFATALAAGNHGLGERAHALAAWSLTTRRRGDLPRAAVLAAESLVLAADSGDLRALARANGAAGTLAAARGDAAGARAHLERGLAIAEQIDDPETRVAALNSLALHLAHEDLPRAVVLAETALALCLTRDDRHRAAALHNTLADLHHARDARDAALGHLRAAVALFAAIGHDQPAIWMLTEW